MRIWIDAELIGKRRLKTKMLANSLSDLVILTSQVARRVIPSYLGYDVLVEVGGGGKIFGKSCKVKIRIKDEKGKMREIEAEGAVIKGEKYCVIGHEALTRLGVKINFATGKIEFV